MLSVCVCKCVSFFFLFYFYFFNVYVATQYNFCSCCFGQWSIHGINMCSFSVDWFILFESTNGTPWDISCSDGWGSVGRNSHRLHRDMHGVRDQSSASRKDNMHTLSHKARRSHIFFREAFLHRVFGQHICIEFYNDRHPRGRWLWMAFVRCYMIPVL